MSIKLVDMTDRRSWIDRICCDPDWMKRERKIAKLVMEVRDAVVAFDREELTEYITDKNLTRQEIEEIRNFLVRDTIRVRYRNEQVDKLLRSLAPDRIWGIR